MTSNHPFERPKLARGPRLPAAWASRGAPSTRPQIARNPNTGAANEDANLAPMVRGTLQ